MKHDFIDQNAREQLSALLDGELGNDDSARFLQRRLQHDDALVGQLVRWQLAGDVLRANARPPQGEADIAGRVRAAIEREQATAKANKPRRGWMLWGSGFATAAALGFAALNLSGTADPAASAPTKVAATAPAPHPTVAPAVPAPITASMTPKAPSPVEAIETHAAHRAPEAAPRHRQRDEVASVSRHVRRDVQDSTPATQQREVAIAATPAINKVKTKLERNPFSMPSTSTPSELAWPKAVLPGLNSGLNADFRTDGSSRNPFMPHRAASDVLQQH